MGRAISENVKRLIMISIARGQTTNSIARWFGYGKSTVRRMRANRGQADAIGGQRIRLLGRPRVYTRSTIDVCIIT